MALVEKQVVFKRKAENGDTEMHFPVTRAEYVEGAVLTVNGESPDSTGDVEITDVSGNAGTATKLATARKVTLGGDASGNVSFDGSKDVTLTVTVTDDSHNHVISNVDGLQSALDGKLSTSGGTMTNTIKFSATQALAKTSASDGLGIYGGTTPLDGAQLVLYGKDSTEAGKFALAANNGTNKVYLYGNADGTLTWNGKNVTIEGDCLPFSGGAMTAAVAMTRNVDSDALQLHGGTSSANGAGLWLYGKDKANLQGTFRLRATASGENIDLIGHKNGTLTWGGKNVVRSVNGTNADANGNVTLSGLGCCTISTTGTTSFSSGKGYITFPSGGTWAAIIEYNYSYGSQDNQADGTVFVSGVAGGTKYLVKSLSSMSAFSVSNVMFFKTA